MATFWCKEKVFRWQGLAVWAFLLVLACVRIPCHSFVLQPHSSSRIDTSRLFYSHERKAFFDGDLLRRRIQDLRVRLIEEDLKRPPNPKLTPTQFVEEILDGLLHPDDPLPDAGYRMLLRASTFRWRSRICRSVGAKADYHGDIHVLASALGSAMARPNNQYAILVGDEEDYAVSFPSDVLDYDDGKCWLECRLRSLDDELLVIMGWQLQRRRKDGAWLVDHIDWQDFRDPYSPGIGREKWDHVCGHM